LFADAAERWERFEMPWERAQALVGQGRCLLAVGKITQATVALRKAREIFDKLGAGPVIRSTDALLSEATALSS
ncbi:MAG: hypothetical protein H0W94_07605, partial [Actinobacteria bacterium]|nr:hypothetical protein [Actinomycetota bacterium]